MSDVVVDASLAIKWVLLEQDSDTAAILLDRWTNEEAKKGLTKLFTIPVSLDFSEYENISAGAMEFAHRFDLPAAYDAHYLALAERESCEYWTADTRLWNAVKRKLSWVRWFGDYHS